jgi:hypothetical protein
MLASLMFISKENQDKVFSHPEGDGAGFMEME